MLNFVDIKGYVACACIEMSTFLYVLEHGVAFFVMHQHLLPLLACWLISQYKAQ